ncbi:PQQ-binding-like beta-propeller repeat protein [Planctomycetaceae bacterium SH139]
MNGKTVPFPLVPSSGSRKRIRRGKFCSLAVCFLFVSWGTAAELAAQEPAQQQVQGATHLNAEATVDQTAADVSTSGQDAWPTDRGDAAATGTTRQQLPDDLVELWRYPTGQPIESTVVVLAGRVFAGDVEGGLHAISLRDGSQIWKQTIESGYLAPPTASEALVMIGDYDGVVHAFDTKTGAPAWEYETKGEISGGVTLAGDTALVSSQDGNLYALDKLTGKELWIYETGDQIRCRPTVAGKRTFLGGCDGSLHSVRITDGQPAADPIPLDGPTGSTPAIVGVNAYLPTHSGAVMAFDWSTGKQLWSYQDADRPQEFRNSAAATPDHVIVANKNRQVIALNPSDGKVQWTAQLKRRADASPVVAGDDVWVTATDGRIYRIDANTGKEKWQYEIRGSFIAPPAVAEQRLLVATDKGVIVCFGAKP